MNQAELLSKINSFPRWHYQFDLNGHQTPIFDLPHINRHQQRKSYFFKPLVELMGGSLEGKRVLDLGCNAGFWSLAAIEQGCDYVLGIDGRQMHIDQANLVFEVNQVDQSRYDFRCGDIFNVLTEDLGSFDIVLCLGLFYHISKHVNLLELISKINTDLLVIDTVISTKNGSLLEFHTEALEEPRNSFDYRLVMLPTCSAVVEMAKNFNYEIATLKPCFTDYTGADDYEQRWRRAFICSQQTDLTNLSVPTEPEAPMPVELIIDETGSNGLPAMPVPQPEAYLSPSSQADLSNLHQLPAKALTHSHKL